jgi:hypothetical protein
MQIQAFYLDYMTPLSLLSCYCQFPQYEMFSRLHNDLPSEVHGWYISMHSGLPNLHHARFYKRILYVPATHQNHKRPVGVRLLSLPSIRNEFQVQCRTKLISLSKSRELIMKN